MINVYDAAVRRLKADAHIIEDKFGINIFCTEGHRA